MLWTVNVSDTTLSKGKASYVTSRPWSSRRMLTTSGLVLVLARFRIVSLCCSHTPLAIGLVVEAITQGLSVTVGDTLEVRRCYNGQKEHFIFLGQ